MATQVQALPEAEADDGDSTYEDGEASTSSVSSSIYAYEIEHGRSYHAFNARKYVLPNDEAEMERMDIEYHALRVLFDDQLFFAPLGKYPQSIIDIGTGTGIWVMDVADKYPSARVIGTDLSPIQPGFVAPNVQFEIHDCTEIPWSYGDASFDLLHTRIMSFGISDWVKFYKESYRIVKPGGWVESQELDLHAFTDDNSFPPNSCAVRWCELMAEGCLKGGIIVRLNSDTLKSAMLEAGFVDVTVKEFKLPIGLWPADERLREAGKFALAAMLIGLYGVSVAIFTRFLSWDIKQMELLLALVRNEFKRRRVHSYWPVFVVYGRKPLQEG